ncbi:BTAD domain-containing putative transcriptional regulator [Geodermatophilus sp. SYSU D00691]
MKFRILGPLEIEHEGRPLDLGRPKQRAVLGILLLHADRVVPVDRLIEDLWDGRPPPHAGASLQAYVYNLRRLLEPGRAPRAPARVLRSQPPGYRLAVADQDLDAARFQALAGEGHRLLQSGQHARAADVLAEGLGLWRGPVLADLADERFVEGERNRLEDLRLTAQEERITADLELGRHAAVAAELEALVAAHPFRERLHGLRMIGLYRAGRQAEALGAYQTVCRLLRDELGVDPSPWLRQLEAEILRQAPELTSPLRVGDTDGPGGAGAAVLAAPPEPPAGGLVGRGEELAVIGRLLAGTAAGHGRVLLVAGEPGVGKTRLAEEAARLAAASGTRVSWGRCWEGEGAPALWPWVQVLRALLGEPPGDRPDDGPAAARSELARLLPELAEAPPASAVPAGSVEATRFRLYDAVTGLLERTAAGRPLLVVLDDLHWSDVPSLQLLVLLAGRVAGARLMVLATHRLGEAGPDGSLAEALAGLARHGAERMVLGGLAESEVAELMATETGAAPDRRLARLVHDRTDGNPFFVVELLRLLASEAGPAAAGSRGGEAAVVSSIPDGVRDVLRRRLALLPEQTNAVLVIAAVVGRSFDLDTVKAATGLADEEALEAVEAALLSGLVVEDPETVDRYRFVHALVREAIYDDVSRARRARLHARVGDALLARFRSDDPEHALEIAHHRWLAAPVTGPQAALPYLVTAADAAVRGLGHEEAEVQLRRALELLGTTPPTRERDRAELDLLLRLGAVLGQLRGPAAAETATTFARALALAETIADDAAEFAALRGLHEAVTSRAEHDRARQLAERLLAVAGRLGRRGFRAAAHMTLGRTLYIQGEYHRARPHLERSLELAESDPVPWPVPLDVTTGVLLGAVLELLGLEEESADAVDAAIRRSRSHPPFVQGTALSMGSHVAVLHRDVALAKERATEALELARRWHFGSIAGYARTVLAWVQAMEGDPAGALVPLRQGLEDIEARGAQLMIPMMLGLTAEAELLAGRPQEALRLVDDALARVGRTGERFTEPELHRLRAQALLAHSPPASAQAAAAYRTAVEVARRHAAAPAERRAGEGLRRLAATAAHSSSSSRAGGAAGC